MKQVKRLLCIMLALSLALCVFGITPITAKADQPAISFTEYSWNEGTKTLQSTTRTTSSYTVVTSDLITNSSDGTGTGLMSGTYVVNADTTIDNYVYIRKDQTVDLIVNDGVTLTCKKGIGCGYDQDNKAATLNIYGSGKIVATGDKYVAGIGGKDDETNGWITIHGTTIEATGGKHGAGIGGGEGGKDPDKTSPTITIFAGNITATGGIDGAGIGGGDSQPGARTYIYSGTITASSKKHGAGIGGGDEEGTYGVHIYGGTITATGGLHGAGIGAGEEGGNMRKSENGGGVNIYGGTVTATGGTCGAGIGGGYNEDMSGDITIIGDTKLTVTGGKCAAGIGAGKANPGVLVTDKGDMSGTITIDCGKNSDIKIFGGDAYKDESSFNSAGGAGIGAGFGGNQYGTVTINGGNIEITGGRNAAGIGGGMEEGKYGGEGGDVYIGGGNIRISVLQNTLLTCNNEAIGAGHEDAKSGSLYISEGVNNTRRHMRVAYMPVGKESQGFKTASSSERSKKTHTASTLIIQECNHNAYQGSSGLTYTISPNQHRIKCIYCGLDETKPHDDGDFCVCGFKRVDTDYLRDVTMNMMYGDPEQLYTESRTVAYGQSFEIPECDKKPTNKRFVGWVLNGDESSLKQSGEIITINENVTLVARYEDYYTVTRADDGTLVGGDIDVTKYSADVDDEITVRSYPNAGYRLKTVIIRENDENGAILIEKQLEYGQSSFTFNMPASDIYVTAEFEEIDYTVCIEDYENGMVTADRTEFSYAELSGEAPVVVLTVTPDTGYRLESLHCREINGGEIEHLKIDDDHYSFTMPIESVTISAEFELTDNIGARLAGHSLILGDDIGVDFYMELSDEVANDETAYMHFTLPNGSVKDISVNDARKDGKYHVFRCKVAAKEMNSNIIAAMYCNSGSASKEYTYTVKEYADHILDEQNGYDDKTKDLVKAMLHYGGCAQQLFSYNTSNRADSGLNGYSASVPDVSESAAGITNNVPAYTNGDITMTYVGSSLVLRSKTVYKLYFTSQKKANELPSLVNTDTNQTYKPIDRTLNGTQYVCYEITGISPQNIRNNISLTYSGTQTNLTVNIGEYARLTMTDANAADEEKALVNALYNYCDKAVAFAGNGGN